MWTASKFSSTTNTRRTRDLGADGKRSMGDGDGRPMNGRLMSGKSCSYIATAFCGRAFAPGRGNEGHRRWSRAGALAVAGGIGNMALEASSDR